MGLARHRNRISVARADTLHCVSAAPQPIGLVVRRARTSDVPAIKALVDIYSGKILLEKNLVTLYEAVQEFWVAELDGELIGCGALHVLWSDLGEVRTVAVHPKVRGHGVGHAIVDRLLDVARELHLERIFVLTFEVEFFCRHGFEEIEGTPVTAEVYEEMCRSYDTGVAEFLDLSLRQAEHPGQHPNAVDALTPPSVSLSGAEVRVRLAFVDRRRLRRWRRCRRGSAPACRPARRA